MNGKKKILIFDDDPDILEVCTFVLIKKGYEVHTKEKCDNVILVIQEIKPDLVLMDNWIPNMGGIEATKLIKSNPGSENTPVIFFSANNDIKSLSQKAGADTFIEKPFDLTDFENLISKYLDTIT